MADPASIISMAVVLVAGALYITDKIMKLMEAGDFSFVSTCCVDNSQQEVHHPPQHCHSPDSQRRRRRKTPTDLKKSMRSSF